VGGFGSVSTGEVSDRDPEKNIRMGTDPDLQHWRKKPVMKNVSVSISNFKKQY
jgi:hypothetical protein